MRRKLFLNYLIELNQLIFADLFIHVHDLKYEFLDGDITDAYLSSISSADSSNSSSLIDKNCSLFLRRCFLDLRMPVYSVDGRTGKSYDCISGCFE